MKEKASYQRLSRFWQLFARYGIYVTAVAMVICELITRIMGTPSIVMAIVFGYIVLIYLYTNRNERIGKFNALLLESAVTSDKFTLALKNVCNSLLQVFDQRLMNPNHELFNFALKQVHLGLRVEQTEHALMVANALKDLIREHGAEQTQWDYSKPTMIKFVNFLLDELDDELDPLPEKVQQDFVDVIYSTNPIGRKLAGNLANNELLKCRIRSLRIECLARNELISGQIDEFIALINHVYTNFELSKFWLIELVKLYTGLPREEALNMTYRQHLLSHIADKIDAGFYLHSPEARLMDLAEWVEENFDLKDEDLALQVRNFLGVKYKRMPSDAYSNTTEQYDY